jgi:hypothetical protein
MPVDLVELIETRLALAEAHASRGLLPYLQEVVIDSRPDPRRYWPHADPWQLHLAGRLQPAIDHLAGRGRDGAGPKSFFFTLPRGHDKTGLIGRVLNYLLCFADRQLSMAVAAADGDQAGLVLESMGKEAGLNPWIECRVKYGRQRAYGPGGVLKVLSADAPTSFGLNCDVYVVDELTHWKKRDLWDVLWSGREKRAGSVFVVITNAGVKGSWQEEILKAAKADPSWSVFEARPEEWLASWMSPVAVARLRSMLPPILARRVIGNEWIDPAEAGGYLVRADVDGCEELGQQLRLGPQERGRSGAPYFAGIDYGPKRDRTAMAVVHYDSAGHRVVLDRLDVIQGSPEAPVPITVVAAWIEQVNKDFTNPMLVVDPYQMEGTIQHYEIRQPVRRFEARGGKSNYEMAECLRNLVTNRQLVWWKGAGWLPSPDPDLTDDFSQELLNLVVRPTTYGYRFDHTVKFHDDRACAVGMAALFAAVDLRTGSWVKPDLMPNPVASDPFSPGHGDLAVNKRNVWGTAANTNDWGLTKRDRSR